jgi:broad specificity phosphatase PhoE
VPVPRWGLSEIGAARTKALAGARWLAGTRRIVTSNETKAIECAEIIAHATGLPVEMREGLGENDRSAIGFLPPSEFEATADRFFAEPNVSVRGWERAIDAQARIVRGFETIVADQKISSGADLLMVGHGAVGTLLMCHLAGWPISRRHDQRPGGGCVFAFELANRRLIHAWKVMEDTSIGDP